MKKIIISLTLCFVFLAIYSIIDYKNREHFQEEEESHISKSSNGDSVIYLESAKVSNDSYCKIFIFDTNVNPNLKEEGTFPSEFQKNNPKALFYIPVKFYARMTNFKWNEKNNTVSIKQTAVNEVEALNYEIDLKDFSFTKK